MFRISSIKSKRVFRLTGDMADDEGGGDANPFNFLAKSKKKGTEAKGTPVPKGRPASFTSKDYNGPIPVETTPLGTTGSVKPGVPADLVIPMPRRDVTSLKPSYCHN